MAYIGKVPTAVPLTSSDITDGIVTTAKIADDAVTTDKASFAPGKVLQVVSTQLTTKVDVTVTSAHTWYDATGFSASITPSSTSSKILFSLSLAAASATPNGHRQYFKIVRGSTDIGIATSTGSRIATYQYVYWNDGTGVVQYPIVWYDSPSTTSATTYKLQVASNATSQIVRLNAQKDDTNTADVNRAVSQLTLMEIAG